MVNGYLPLRRDVDSKVIGEKHIVTLTNTEHFPFNSTMTKPTTVALNQNAANLDYKVDVELLNKKGGGFIEAHIDNKALNGFKVWFEGSAKEVTLELTVLGI